MHKYRTITAAFITVLAIFISMTSQSLAASWPPIDFDALPSYVRVVIDANDSAQVSMPDSIFYQVSGKTVFKVNSSKINLDDPLLRQLANDVLPYANSNELMLVGIDLRGAASPEGPYKGNVRLSRERANALRNFLYTRLDSMLLYEIATQTVAEDYIYLLYSLEQSDDPDAEIVREIITKNNYDEAKIKSDLKKHDKGRLWARLLKQYFPDLRAARIVLYFKRIYPKKDYSPAVTVDPTVWRQPLEPLAAAELADTPSPYLAERRHIWALSSNLLYDAFYMPNFGWAPMLNIAAEYYPPHGNFTFRAQFTNPYYHRWAKNKFFQIRDYHLEVRRYFSPGIYHTGAYLGLYANATKYGIGFNAKKGWEGEGYGGALKAGYVVPLGKGRWRLDLHVAAGAFITRYDPYVYGNPISGTVDGDYYYDWTEGASTFNRRNHRFTWMGPTEIGVTLTYDVLYKRIKQSGVSTRSKEVIR